MKTFNPCAVEDGLDALFKYDAVTQSRAASLPRYSSRLELSGRMK